MTGDELLAALVGIPPGVTSLNLSVNGLHHKTADELAIMAASLSHITTVFISLSDIEAMTAEQRLALKNIFPRVKTKDIILLDSAGNSLPAGRKNLVVSLLGFGPKEVPSLKALSALSLIQNPGPATPGPVPMGVEHYVASFRT